MNAENAPDTSLVETIKEARSREGWELGPPLTVPRPARSDGENQILQIITTWKPESGFMITAVDEERGLRAEGSPSPDQGIAIRQVPWYLLDR
jgi:hypothetical protein